MFKSTRSFSAGFVLGLGTGLVAREIWPLVKESGRPVIKGFTKASLQVYEMGQETLSSAFETVEDILAESRFEIKDKRKKSVKEKVKDTNVKKTQTKKGRPNLKSVVNKQEKEAKVSKASKREENQHENLH